jgi:predicted type IV restriction endonuclease
MDFADKIHELASHLPEKVAKIQLDNSSGRNEGTTKTSLVLPFIQSLGYDIFDPNEVKAEYTLDMGGANTDRIDYALFKNDEAKILIECKSCNVDINKATYKQLKRYFGVANAKFGILTNGIKYRFFSDLDNPGKMDDTAFLELDMMNIKDSNVAVIKNFCNPMDDVEASRVAHELKCKGEIRAILEREFNKPSKEFVLFFASQIHDGHMVKSVIKPFCSYTKETCDQFIQDKIDDFVKAATSTARNMVSPPPRDDPVKSFIFDDAPHEIKFWKDMLPMVCSIMVSNHKDRFEDILTIKGDSHIYFSRNQEELMSPEPIEGSDIFVATNFDKRMLLNVAKKVVTLFNYPEDIVSFGEEDLE